MSSKRLRDATLALRMRAEMATPGPWGVGNRTIVGRDMVQTSRGSCSYKTQVCEPDPFNYEDDSDDPDGDAVRDAQYIAMMHPGVALALADWLDVLANNLEAHGVDLPDGEPSLRLADQILGSAAEESEKKEEA